MDFGQYPNNLFVMPGILSNLVYIMATVSTVHAHLKCCMPYCWACLSKQRNVFSCKLAKLHCLPKKLMLLPRNMGNCLLVRAIATCLRPSSPKVSMVRARSWQKSTLVSCYLWPQSYIHPGAANYFAKERAILELIISYTTGFCWWRPYYSGNSG